MPLRGSSTRLWLAAALLLLAGIGLWTTRFWRGKPPSVTSSATISVVPGDSDNSAESMPVSTNQAATEVHPARIDPPQDSEPNDVRADGAVGPEPAVLPATMPTAGPPEPGYIIRGKVVSTGGFIREQPGQWPGTLLARVDGPGYARQCELDDEGRFECTGLDAGTYVVSVSGPSLSDRVQSSLPGEAVEVTLGPLSPLAEPVLVLGKEVAVTVVVLEQGNLLPRADETVVARSVSGVSKLSGGTDDRGCCVLGLVPGRYWIDVESWESRRGASMPQLLLVEPDGQGLSVQLFVPAREERMVRFVLVDSQGNPVKGYVDLDAVSPDPNRRPADTIAIPDPGQGGFGRLVGCARDASGELARCFVCAEEAWGDGMKLVLEPRAGIVGRLLSADGLSAGVRLDLQQFLPDERWRAVDKSLYKLATDGEGGFRFDGVPVGLEVRVCATAGRYQGDSGPLALGPGAARDIGAILLRPPESAPATGPVHGYVIDESGEALSDRLIWTSSGGEWTRGLLKDGQIVVGGVPAGRPVTIRLAIPGVGDCAVAAMAGDRDCIFQVNRAGGELLGVPAPALVVDRWINHAPMTWEQLRGRVVLLTFRDLRQDSDLSAILSLCREYRSRGLIVIAVYGHVSQEGPFDEETAVRHILDLFRGAPLAGCLDADPNLVADLTPQDGPENAFAGATHSIYLVHLGPAFFLIDKQGRVRCCAELNEIREQIELLLQE